MHNAAAGKTGNHRLNAENLTFPQDGILIASDF